MPGGQPIMVDAMVPVVSLPSVNSTEPFAVLHPALADTRPAWLKSRVSGRRRREFVFHPRRSR